MATADGRADLIASRAVDDAHQRELRWAEAVGRMGLFEVPGEQIDGRKRRSGAAWLLAYELCLVRHDR